MLYQRQWERESVTKSRARQWSNMQIKDGDATINKWMKPKDTRAQQHAIYIYYTIITNEK